MFLVGCDQCIHPAELTIKVNAVACARSGIVTTYQITCYGQNAPVHENDPAYEVYSSAIQSTRDIVIFHEVTIDLYNRTYCVLETENQTEYIEEINVPFFPTCSENTLQEMNLILDFQGCT